ncbi:type II toxin-antitoxin system HipA family toxin [Bradyrhizobium erythrophlei]|uniref:type II toxin-antitoxin system HipA family toxin n=1 Tax=Bradyrhizobium erythrophlei TaxID=1437360 RepID=UPI0035EAD2EC
MRIQEKSPPVAGDSLEVRYEDKLVGRIRRRTEAVHDIEFVYDEAWMSNPNGFPVSTRMPLGRRMHEPDVVYTWFQNLLPEGRTLQTIGAILRIPETDVFALLEEMGEDLPGALAISRPLEERPKRNPRYRKLTEAELAETIRRLPERPFLVGEEGIHMSLAGAEDKLPVVQYPDGAIGLALDGMPTTHILKPANKRFHSAVENEAFCLRLAAAVKLPVAECSIGKAEDVEYLLVKRYDRPVRSGRVRRIHQEDFCQATGYIPHLKYEWNPQTKQPGPGLMACLDVLTSTGNAAANKIRFIDYMVFNVLCGNVDAHAKNYSLLLEASGAVTMAPLYDVMNGEIYEGVTRNLAMKVAGRNRGRYISARHWDRFAEENALSATQVKRRVASLSQAVLDTLPRVVAEMNAVKKSPTYQQIEGYVASTCRSMLSNLKYDVEDEPEEDEKAAPAARAPGFS